MLAILSLLRMFPLPTRLILVRLEVAAVGLVGRELDVLGDLDSPRCAPQHTRRFQRNRSGLDRSCRLPSSASG